MVDTLEYIFFHSSISRKLCSYLEKLDVEYSVTEQDDIITVSHADDLDDELLEAIERYYDDLFDEESRTVNEADDLTDDQERDVVGIGVELSDGSLIQVRLPPDVTRRLLTIMTTEELRGMVNEIALQVETPIDGPLCKGETRRGAAT